MESVLSIAVFTLLGVALVTATIWYVDLLRQRFFATDTTPAIAPIEVVGADEATVTRMRTSLPVMIVAATNALKSRTNQAIRTLDEARAELAQQHDLPERADLPVPTEFREPLAISLKVADVEVGSIVSRLLEGTRNPNLVRLTVAMGTDGKPSNVYGVVPGREGYTFSAQAETDIQRIAEAIAIQFVQRAAHGGEAAFGALAAADFLTTISSLEEFARLAAGRRWILTDPKSPSDAEAQRRAEYRAILERVRQLARRYTGWEGLQWLAAFSAREAGEWESAREFYANLRRVADRAGKTALSQRIALLVEEVERERTAAERARLPSQPMPVAATTTAPAGAAVRPVLAALGMTEGGRAAGVRIGILGPPPDRSQVPDVKIDVIPGSVVTEDPAMLAHAADVVQAVRIVAPDPTFVFAPFARSVRGALRMSDLLDAFARLLDHRPDVVLVTVGSSEPSAALDEMIRTHAGQAIFVLPAGNTPPDSGYRNVADIALVAAAATLDGERAPFTSVPESAVWVPGANIPIVWRTEEGERVERRSGTSFSAALAAGVAAVLKHQFPTATPAQMRQALIQSSRAVQGRSEPAIINVPAAMQALRAAPRQGT